MPRRPQASSILRIHAPSLPASSRLTESWHEDEESVVRCDVVLGELRPPNDAMAQMLLDQLRRVLTAEHASRDGE